VDRKMRTERYSHRSAPYGRESRRGFRFLVSSLLCCLPTCLVFITKYHLDWSSESLFVL